MRGRHKRETINMLAAIVGMIGSSAASIQASAVELFLFKSKGRSAVAFDREGVRLPRVPEGWIAMGSLGDHSAFLDDAGFDRVRAAGFEIYEDQKPSKRLEDWAGMPRGSFRFTRRAASRIKLYYTQTIERTGKAQILALQYAPIKVKSNDSAEWRELGDRIVLGSYDAIDVPKAAVRRYDGVPILLLMDPKTLPNPRPKLIDYNGSEFVFAK